MTRTRTQYRNMEMMMTANSKMTPTAETIILIAYRSGVWNVKVADRFHGDYLRKDEALAAATQLEQSITAKGGRARVVAA